jgi:hypothetical protein
MFAYKRQQPQDLGDPFDHFEPNTPTAPFGLQWVTTPTAGLLFKPPTFGASFGGGTAKYKTLTKPSCNPPWKPGYPGMEPDPGTGPNDYNV